MANSRDSRNLQLREDLKPFIDERIDNKIKDIPKTKWKDIIDTIPAPAWIKIIGSAIFFASAFGGIMVKFNDILGKMDKLIPRVDTIENNQKIEMKRLDMRIDHIELPSSHTGNADTVNLK